VEGGVNLGAILEQSHTSVTSRLVDCLACHHVAIASAWLDDQHTIGICTDCWAATAAFRARECGRNCHCVRLGIEDRYDRSLAAATA
jgi:hypothetical protein